MFQIINSYLAIGADTENQPEKLGEIAEKGYKSLVDLCAPPEPKKLDSSAVQTAGLEYTSFPITPANLNQATLQSFLQIVENSPKPLYIRCASGLRAGIFTVLALMAKEDMNYQEKLGSLGIQPKSDCPVNAFAQEYLQTQGKLN